MEEENRRGVSSIAKVYDSPEDAEHYFRRSSPSSLWDWVRDKQLAIAVSYIDSYLDSLTYDRNMQALDIGCNSGRYTKALLQNAEGLNAVGVDTANIPLTYALKWVPQANFIQASAIDLPFKSESFDIIVCIELLHHFTDKVVVKALKQIAGVLKPGGFFIFDLKNKLNPVMWYRYRRKDSIELTLKTRTISQIIRLVEANGFKVIKRKGIPPIPLAPFVVLCATKIGKEKETFRT